MNRARLNAEDFARADALLAVPPGVARAVCTVEAPDGGFDAVGRPRILFEGHHFARMTGGRFNATHPDISYPRWTRARYAKGSNPDARNAGEHQRLARAVALDKRAALSSASWGRFQIMGSNHLLAGCGTLQEFINEMHRSEAAHLDAFCAFVRSHPAMHRALKALDWAAFARAYNGPLYAANAYDTKLAAAYRKARPAEAAPQPPAPPASQQTPAPQRPPAPPPIIAPRPAEAPDWLGRLLRWALALFTRKKL